MVKTSNKGAKYYVAERIDFKGNNTFGKNINPNLYVVYSYGTHWILYLYDGENWFECNEKTSSTTSKHSTQLKPLYNEFIKMTQMELQKYCNNLNSF
jgi:hypothetical protein